MTAIYKTSMPVGTPSVYRPERIDLTAYFIICFWSLDGQNEANAERRREKEERDLEAIARNRIYKAVRYNNAGGAG